MKIKKLFLMMFMLCSLGAVSAPTFSNNIKSNNDTIVVNNEKVNLRQKAIKKANDTSSEIANIETTNVDYDLRYIFGGEKNYLSYNIWDLVPNSNNSKDTSFKFLCAKPVGNNLYLYVYHNDNRNGNIISATTKISKSKSLNSETGEFVENFALYEARFINSYGYKQRFMKFAIDNIFNSDEDVRCFIENLYIRYQDTTTTNHYFTNTYTIHDEFMFGLNNGDYMYEYFKNNYVRVVDGEVSMLLTKIDDSKHFNLNGTMGNNYSDWAEDFYYFFTTDYEIEDLIEIQYDYYLTSYTHHYDNEGRYNPLDLNDTINWRTYIGLMNEANITSEDVLYLPNNKITKGSTSTDYTRPYFLWWNKDYTYKLENIQNCLDTSNLSGEEHEGFLKFINQVQDKRKQDNKPKYEWAFRVGSYLRTSNYVLTDDWISWLIGKNVSSNTYAHEIKQTIITWLKFRTDNIDFEFNVLDIPKDTTSVYIQDVPFDTLGDIIVENIISFWDWFKDSGGWQTILILLGVLGGILLFIYLYPFISAIFKVIAKPFKKLNSNTKSKKKKSSSNKKNKKPKKKGG